MENIVGMLPLILMVVVIYFFFIRPQAKKQKAQSNFVNEIKKGDEVVTGSGIIGKITKLEDSIAHLQVDQKTFIRVLRTTISKELTDGLKGAK
jgi:preprotein translocase subunit YajC